MKIIVYGASKGVGRELVRQGLERGHTVTAFVRDASHLTENGGGLSVVEGDVLDTNATEQAMSGQDAALVTLGAHGMKPTNIRYTGTQNVMRAMHGSGVSRLVCLSTIGIDETAQLLTFPLKYILFPLIIKNHVADHKQQERVVRESDLDWTIVRAGVLKNGERTGAYRAGFPPTAKIKVQISRADVADFMLNQLDDSTYVRKSPSVSY